jgi:surface protein
MKYFLLPLFVFITFISNAQTEFVTVWNLSLDAGSGPDQISFGVATGGVVNYTWETIPAGTNGAGTFTGTTATITGLPAGSTIRLTILPTNFQRININNGANRRRLVDVSQWGTMAWTSLQNSFYGCENLNITATDLPNFGAVANMSQAFRGCTSLNGPANINSWNTAAATNMSLMFYQATVLIKILAIGIQVW